jgi:uncharacterized protein YyaL (SSP411 family)
MLYDNAALARVYLEAYQATHDLEYRRVARETLDYAVREMQDAEGVHEAPPSEARPPEADEVVL